MPTNASPLDSTAFPHILDTVFRHASPAALLTLRRVSRSFRDRADAALAAHLVLEDRGMGGRWFAAWHASLDPSAKAGRDVDALLPGPARRLHVLGAPPADGYYNWQAFARAGQGPFTPGVSPVLVHTRLLDLIGPIGVLTDGRPKLPVKVPLIRLLPGHGGDLEELPPPCDTLALFPDVDSMDARECADVKPPASCSRVVINAAHHCDAGFVRTRISDFEHVNDLVINFGRYEGECAPRRQDGGLSFDETRDGPHRYLQGSLNPVVDTTECSNDDADEEDDAIPWTRMGPRQSDPLRWQELAYLVALALASRVRVTLVNFGNVQPAWLDEDFACTDDCDRHPTDGPNADMSRTSGRPRSVVAREIRAMLRGLALGGGLSFWLVTGMRIYGLFRVDVPDQRGEHRVRFLSAEEYARERRIDGVDATLELDPTANCANT